MSYQQIFLSAFFGGLGLGLAAIICIYLASALDKAEGAIKELWGIRRAMKKDPAGQEQLPAAARMQAGTLPGAPPSLIEAQGQAMATGAFNSEVKKSQCEHGCHECSCGSVFLDQSPHSVEPGIAPKWGKN